MKYINIIISHYRDRSSIFLFFAWIYLRLLKAVKFGFIPNEVDIKKIDIVIPTVSKDIVCLGKLIKSLRNVNQVINNVYIVAPSSRRIKEYCLANNLKFVDENSVLGFGKDYINYSYNGEDRSGWLFQQLLKLAADKFVEMDDYLAIDSDTVFVNKLSFISNSKYIFYANEEWHSPYFVSFENLFGSKAPTKFSLTSHMMIFNRNLLNGMKNDITSRTNLKWYDGYISSCSTRELSGISDYETYANWVLLNYPNKAKIYPFYNRNSSRDIMEEVLEIESNKNRLHSVSFHSYLD